MSSFMKPTTRGPDFLIIGAQKCATTSLFRYLAEHPLIYMPAQKETEFFYREAEYQKGFDWYQSHYFSDAPKETVLGEASPQYMCSPDVPHRIASVLPDVRLVAILRNPIDRAYSHHRMSVRRGLCADGFRPSVEVSRQRPSDVFDVSDAATDFFRFGEYGRILAGFDEYFGRDRIKVLFAEELAENSVECIMDLYAWLGVGHEFVPANIDRKYHQSGDKRFPRLERTLKGASRLKALARKAMGLRLYSALYFWFETELNIKSKIDEEGPSREDREWLRRLYYSDVRTLELYLNRKTPWPEFRKLDRE